VPERRRPAWLPRTAGAAAGAVLAVSLAGTCAGLTGHPPVAVHTAPMAGTAAATRPSSDTAAQAAPLAPLPPSTPVALAIPALRLNAPLLALGLDRTGAVETPPFSMPGTAAWFRDSPSPGTAGAAVIVGHVDTKTGPAVFWGLSALHPGAQVNITRVDGRTAVFTVRGVKQYPKGSFPTDAVYGTTNDPELRLVTCGGKFDKAKGEYLGNVVVFAGLTGVR
jgi:hypothetical protein